MEGIEGIVRIIIYVSVFIGFFTLTFYLLGFISRKREIPKLKELPQVSIIIPAYNEEETLEKTVESAVALNYPKNKFEILIVDDGSRDRTLEIAKTLAKKYENVRAFTKKNGGKASAMNLGIKKSRGEIVISFDADSMVVKEALIKMVPYFADPKVMCVTPALKVWKPKGILQRVQAIEYDLGIFLRKAFSNINTVHVTPGPFSAYRKEFFEQYGGYEVGNITEDMEIAMRIQSLNKEYRIENCIEAVVYTVAPNKLRDLTIQRRRWYFGMIKNLSKYRHMFSKEYGELGVLIFPMAIFSIATTMIVTLYYIIKAIVDGLRDIRDYSLIGFDFVNNWQFKYYMLSLNLYKSVSEQIMVFTVFFLIVTLCILLIVNWRAKTIDRPLSTFISYVFFMFFYSILFTIWWIISIIYAGIKTEINWR